MLVPFNDVPAIGAADLKLIDTPKDRRKLACAGREHIEKNFDAADMVRSIERLYDVILRIASIALTLFISKLCATELGMFRVLDTQLCLIIHQTTKYSNPLSILAR